MKQQQRDQRAHSHRAKAQQVIGQHLGGDQLAHQQRRGHDRLHRAALPLARHHQGGEQRADDRHHHSNGTGHQKIAADRARIEPVAQFEIDHRGIGMAACDGALLHPIAAHALGIVGHERGIIGHRAIGDRLDRALPIGNLAAEILRDHDDATDGARHQIVLQRGHRADLHHLEPARIAIGLCKAGGGFASILLGDADTGAAGVEVEGIAEDQQQDDRQQKGDQDGGRIAQDLQGFLQRHGAQAAERDRRAHAASLRSASRISAAKASSMLATPPASARSSAGVPVAIWRER